MEPSLSMKCHSKSLYFSSRDSSLSPTASLEVAQTTSFLVFLVGFVLILALKSVFTRKRSLCWDLVQPKCLSIHSEKATLLTLWIAANFWVLYLWQGLAPLAFRTFLTVIWWTPTLLETHLRLRYSLFRANTFIWVRLFDEILGLSFPPLCFVASLPSRTFLIW